MNFHSAVVLFVVTVFSHTFIHAQDLSGNRIKFARASIVRILVDGNPSGTGFVISRNGEIATCWHVIEPALRGNVRGVKKIEAEFVWGETVELSIISTFLNKGNRDAVGFDYCCLEPLGAIKGGFNFLRLGSFDGINEGDKIYTIGYPLGIKQQFVSSGILSTKWQNTAKFISVGKPDSLIRSVAWLDLTMNKGNSGGPVIKIGKTPEEDEVIGIASFILNPYANTASQLSEFLKTSSVDMELNGVSHNKVNRLFADAISNNSIGISGCISIDHMRAAIRK